MMKTMMIPATTLLMAGLLVMGGCDSRDTGGGSGGQAAPDPAAERERHPVVEERYMTPRDAGANVDSVAVWHDGEARHWLIATAKEADQLLVFDAAEGDLLRQVGGGEAVDLSRPNGIAVLDDLLLVVERDHRRVQVFSLPDFRPLGRFGEEHLIRPYGLWVNPVDGGYDVYVTDAYETADEGIPPDAELDRRIQVFRMTLEEGEAKGRWRFAAGETEGPGVLREVESLWGDPRHDQLLVADEAGDQLNLKVYDLQGRFTGRVIGEGLFQHQPEGITQYTCEDGQGYWIVADQHETVNVFRLFERGNLEPLGGFEGAQVLNTDGVWLTREAMPGMPDGAFFAVHDDGSAAAFALDEVLPAMGLDPCR
ncbi:MAG: hypothetical protein ACLFRJ_08005 [Ectothiorhodospira sp.]